MAGDTRVTSTNSKLFPLYNGELTFEHTFFISYICKYAAGLVSRSIPTELMRTFNADYVNHNNHRKHVDRSNNCVSMPTRVLGGVRNNLNVWWILKTRLPCVI